MFPKGTMTYTGIGVMVVTAGLGLLGIGECAPGATDCVSGQELAQHIVEAVQTLGFAAGTVIAAFGRRRATKGMKPE